MLTVASCVHSTHHLEDTDLPASHLALNQHQISEIVQGIDGCEAIIDDILIWGRNIQYHKWSHAVPKWSHSFSLFDGESRKQIERKVILIFTFYAVRGLSEIYGFKIVGYLERIFKLLWLMDVADLNWIEFDELWQGSTWYETCRGAAFFVWDWNIYKLVFHSNAFLYMIREECGYWLKCRKSVKLF